MKIIVNDISYHVDIPIENERTDKKPIVFLHGFTGSSGEWSFLDHLDPRFYPIKIDLIGHGKTESPEDAYYYSAKEIVYSIKEIFNQLNLTSVILYGYSMGGRAALSFAVNYPNMLDALILESSSPGIDDPERRRNRAADDERLSQMIINEGIEAFINYWINIPLFDSQKNAGAKKLGELKKQKCSNNITGLANSLYSFSTGKMPSYWNDIKKLKFNTLLLTGEFDKKFDDLNGRMNKLFPNSDHVKIKAAGHNIHFEQPMMVINLLNEFLDTI